MHRTKYYIWWAAFTAIALYLIFVVHVDWSWVLAFWALICGALVLPYIGDCRAEKAKHAENQATIDRWVRAHERRTSTPRRSA